MSSTLLSSRPISVSNDIFIVLRDPQNDNVIERPMFMPDATSGGFLLDFCLYCYKIKLYIHHFLPLMAVVCPSETPSVLSGINRIQRWAQSKPLYLAFSLSSCQYIVFWWKGRGDIRNKHLFGHEAGCSPLPGSVNSGTRK